jgi:hypothetical protein
MKGMAVEQVLLIFVCVVVAIGILIWYWQTYAKGSSLFTQSECQQAITLRCNEWKAAAMADPMRVRFFCKNSIPQACHCDNGVDVDGNPYGGVDGYHEAVFSVWDGAWFNCAAPGCEATYGMKIRNANDCPG